MAWTILANVWVIYIQTKMIRARRANRCSVVADRDVQDPQAQEIVLESVTIPLERTEVAHDANISPEARQSSH